MERWTGRVAMVTGANSGIGAATAQKLVKAGLKVVGLGLTVENIQAMSKALQSEKGKLYAVTCDVTQEDQVKQAFQWVRENLGGVDSLINCAAVLGPNSILDDPVDGWQTVVNTNLLGLCMCSKYAVQCMRARGVHDGHIININSIAGHRLPLEPRAVLYHAMKHGVTVVSDGLRKELLERKLKIRVTSLSPGLVDTNLPPREYFQIRTYLQPEDIADGILYALDTPPHVQVQELTITPL